MNKNILKELVEAAKFAVEVLTPDKRDRRESNDAELALSRLETVLEKVDNETT